MDDQQIKNPDPSVINTWIDSLHVVIQFLIDNEQFGDDFSQEINNLNQMIEFLEQH